MTFEFRASDAETGRGAFLGNAVVIRFAMACPNLVHVSLDGAAELTDESLSSFFANCQNLRYIQFSGNDRVSGTLKGTALDLPRETLKA